MVEEVVVRKVKSDPILVKLIDFNVAVQADSDSPKIKGSTRNREWSAPETRNFSGNYDFKIDSWALGCVMYYICTGQQPFCHNDDLTVRINFEEKLIN